MKQIGFAIALSVAGVFSAGATSYDLAGLIGNTIQIGDKNFTFVSASVTGFGSFTPAAGTVSAGQFIITPDVFGNLVGFSLSGSITATATSPPPNSQSTVDLALVYTVATVSGLPLMTDLHLGVNGGCAVTGTGVGNCGIQVTETATDAGLNSVINPSTLQATIANSPQAANFTSAQSFIRITKDISLIANAVSGNVTTNASVSIVDQFVSQTPEPGFYGVLALGIASLLWVRRRTTAS